MEIGNRRHVAKDGMLFTNDTVFAKELWLGDWDSIESWNEITEEEAAAIQKEKEQEALNYEQQ